MSGTFAGTEETAARLVEVGFLPGADDDAATPIGRVGALDGIRTLAVFLVLFFHIGVPGLSGGYLGVDAFFVLSGFLITTLLMRDIVAIGYIDLPRFWARRMARLLPAALLLFLVVAAWALLFAPSFRRPAIGADLLWCILYVGNWHFVATASYFTNDGTVSPLLHLWSLGVEEQFYVLWPLLLQAVAMLLASASHGRHARRDTVGARDRTTKAVIATGIFVAVISLLLMARAYAGSATGADRAYMGTDTKVFEPILGAVFAAATLRPTVAAFVTRHAQLLMGLGALGLLAGVAFLGGHDGPQPAYFYGGALGVSLSVIALVAGATKAHAGRGIARIFSQPVVAYLGRISYGLYLWHWPWAVWLLPRDRFDPALALLSLSLTIASAAASYHLVELPLRSGRFRRLRPVRILRVGIAGMAASCVVAALLGATPLYAGVVLEEPQQPRLLLVGDSVPMQLTSAFAEVGAARDVVVQSAAHGGCAALGVVTLNGDGTVYDPPTPRIPGSAGPICAGVIEDQARAVEKYHPSVVLWWSRYEYADRLGPDGKPLRATDPGFWEAQRASLDLAVDRLTATGARLMVLEPEPVGLTIARECADPAAPCHAFLRRLMEDDAQRLKWVSVLRDKAAVDRRLTIVRIADIFCRDAKTPCDDHLPLNPGTGFPSAGPNVARSDGSHFVPAVHRELAELVLRRVLGPVATTPPHSGTGTVPVSPLPTR